jgi:hypothetical protein
VAEDSGCCEYGNETLGAVKGRDFLSHCLLPEKSALDGSLYRAADDRFCCQTTGRYLKRAPSFVALHSMKVLMYFITQELWGPTQSPTKWIGVPSSAGKRPGCEATSHLHQVSRLTVPLTLAPTSYVCLAGTHLSVRHALILMKYGTGAKMFKMFQNHSYWSTLQIYSVQMAC